MSDIYGARVVTVGVLDRAEALAQIAKLAPRYSGLAAYSKGAADALVPHERVGWARVRVEDLHHGQDVPWEQEFLLWVLAEGRQSLRLTDSVRDDIANIDASDFKFTLGTTPFLALPVDEADDDSWVVFDFWCPPAWVQGLTTGAEWGSAAYRRMS